MKPLDRRGFLALGALAGTGALVAPRFAFGGGGADTPPARFVFLILRGALDGLAAVPPYGDVDYTTLRRDLAIAAPGNPDGALRLDARFGLHPSLGFLHESYGAGELVVLHATASPYRERSHFDGQDVLESGGTRAHELGTGWLNRALAALPPGRAPEAERGIALGQNVPLVMRGSAAVASWSPTGLPALDEDTLQRLTDLYAGDALLSRRLAEALATDAIAAEAAGDSRTPAPAPVPTAVGEADMRPVIANARGRYLETVKAAAGFLRRDDGPQVAVFDTTGWDTHANEGGARGQLATRLAVLDAALRTLRDSLGDTWSRTAVLVATEFGRTAAVNGTHGSDHGTGAAAFLLGGAVRGGRVLADWPGLSPGALYQGRDLAATLDIRAVIKGVLHEHLGVREDSLRTTVFPGSDGVPALGGLIRV